MLYHTLVAMRCVDDYKLDLSETSSAICGRQ
jgi:hypothetical protein